MGWNGSGNYQRTNGSFSGANVWDDDANAGFDIVAARHDTHDQDLAQGINACLTKDGQNSPTANLPMAGFKHTSVADGSARNQYATVGQLQDQGVQALSSVGGTANAITAGMTPTISAYVTGARYTFKAISNSSSTVTLKIDSAPAVAVQYNGAALVNGEIAANQWHTVVYDGSLFQLLNPAMSASTRTLPASVAQVQDGDYIWLGTTGGTATAQTATASPAITAYKAGQKFRMIVGAGLSSSGQSPTTHTININGIGAKQIVSADGMNSAPTIGSWVAGSLMELIYDGTNFRITNDPSGWQTFSPNLSGLAPNVLNTPSYIRARFIKRGKIVHILAWWSFGVTTGGGSVVQFALPVKADDSVAAWTNQPNWCYPSDSAGSVGGYVYLASSTVAYVNKFTTWAVTAAGGAEVRISMTYEAA